MCRGQRRRRGAGFSLIEVALVLAIVSLLLSGVMMFRSSAAQKTRVEDSFRQLLFIQSTANQLAANREYTDITGEVLARIGEFPIRWMTPERDGLLNPFGGSVTVRISNPVAEPGLGGGDGQSLVIILHGIPYTACLSLAARDPGTGLVRYYINSQSVRDIGEGFENLQAACDRSDPASVGWVIF